MNSPLKIPDILARALALPPEAYRNGEQVPYPIAEAGADGYELAGLVVEYFGEGDLPEYLDCDHRLRNVARAMILKSYGQDPRGPWKDPRKGTAARPARQQPTAARKPAKPQQKGTA